MKEVTAQLRKYFIDLITPLTINGETINVNNLHTRKVLFPAVLITSTANLDGTKCARDWEVNTKIEIVVRNKGDWGGDQQTEEISNEILNIIDSSRPVYGTTTDFDIITQTVTANDSFTEEYAEGRIVRKEIIVNNYVSQKI